MWKKITATNSQSSGQLRRSLDRFGVPWVLVSGREILVQNMSTAVKRMMEADGRFVVEDSEAPTTTYEAPCGVKAVSKIAKTAHQGNCPECHDKKHGIPMPNADAKEMKASLGYLESLQNEAFAIAENAIEIGNMVGDLREVLQQLEQLQPLGGRIGEMAQNLKGIGDLARTLSITLNKEESLPL